VGARGIESGGSGRGVWNGGTRMSSENPRTALFRSPSFPEGGLPEIIRGKYKLRILWRLQDGSLRFGALRKELAKGCVRPKGIAPRVLSRELKSLVELGLIQRRAYNVVPPKVEYRLTALGQTVLPVIATILEWGSKHLLQRSACKELSLMPRSLVVETSEKTFVTQVGRNTALANRVHPERFALRRRNSIGRL
jgi:DNA-binding HxlR family transcriptional regulator